MPITLNGDTGIQTPMYNGTITANAVTPSVNMKNRIINGAMVIDQRNAGASVNNTAANNIYTLDRWSVYGSASAKFSIQRNAGSVTPPEGFTNYLGITSLSSYSVSAGEFFYLYQPIEGFNMADLSWGTANAKTVTLSFWIRSSLTGSFSGSLTNGAFNRSYPFSYTISAANTWEYKTVTVAGDTTGTWATDNTTGMNVFFNIGSGSTYLGTANAWTASGRVGVTSSTSVVGTNGATFYITGVQLERGTTATGFDYRPYGTELALCQRYFQSSFDIGTAPANDVANRGLSFFNPYGTNDGWGNYVYFKTTMRGAPTITFFKSFQEGSTNGQLATYDGSWTSLTSTSVSYAATNGFTPTGSRVGGFTAKQALLLTGNWTASAEL